MPRLHAESPGLSLAETTARREPRPCHIIYVVLERRTRKSAFLESRFPAGAMQELARWPLAPRGPAAPQSRLWAAGPTGPLLTPTPPRPSDFAQMPVLPLPGGAKEGARALPAPLGPGHGVRGRLAGRPASAWMVAVTWAVTVAFGVGARPCSTPGTAASALEWHCVPQAGLPPRTVETRLPSASAGSASARSTGLGVGAQGPGCQQPAASPGPSQAREASANTAACAPCVLCRVLTIKSARERKCREEKTFPVFMEKNNNKNASR